MSDDKDKKLYELAFLLENESGMADVLRLSSQHNLDVKSEGQPKKINLAYKIGKLTQAHLGCMRFSGLPDDIKSLEKDLKTAASVLRSMIVILPKEANAPREPMAPEKWKPVAPKKRPAVVHQPQRPAPEALSNEALERKIEEILQ